MIIKMIKKIAFYALLGIVMLIGLGLFLLILWAMKVPTC